MSCRRLQGSHDNDKKGVSLGGDLEFMVRVETGRKKSEGISE